MQFKALIVAAVASVAMAQSSTACAGQNIVDACIGTIQSQINACSTTDFSCLCTGYTNMLNCYAPCPTDPKVGTAQQQKQLNCANASIYGTTTSVRASSATSVAASTTNAMTSASSATRSGSSASASSTLTNGAENKAASGLLALAAVGAVAFL